ncbi:hypothetical protein [Pseudomonas putida]|uniref:Uncharacterized protein n=1 Tax=Pseudomonas putida TaxID=303 RepID=A0A8I1E9R8_PSEPU|nr:hypothetical protein [Pseudomonas putida]MBI6882420.1 hypothetical protein [Pseudomonas putida]
MASNIQTALKNCLSREAERLKKYDWNSNSEDNVACLIGGAILGVSAVTLIASAGGIANIPSYVELKAAQSGAVVSHFIADHATAIMGVGGSIVTTAAMVFLKGLKEEQKVLKQRVDHAFNKLGHGLDYIKNVEQAYDAVLANNEVLVKEVNAEAKWISSILSNPTQRQAEILAPTGAFKREVATIETLKAAYIHGVKKTLADAVSTNSIFYGRLGCPSMAMEKSIISGMLDYYVAADKKVPGVIDKLHFVLVGDPDALKSPERAERLTNNAINAILELKGKKVVKRENRQESRYADDFGL